MSVRKLEQPSKQAQFRAELAINIEAQRQAELTSLSASGRGGVVDHLDGLTETERSAAQLGVSPDEWKPIEFLNKAHYHTLLKNNALSGPLAQKLEAFKEVSNGA